MKFILAALLFVVAGPLAAYTAPGTVISNTATATFDASGSVGLMESSNTVNVTSTIIRTAATLTLLQYRPAAPVVSSAAPSQCRLGSVFTASANPSYPSPGAGITTLDPAQLLPLAPTSIYNGGEPVFIQVGDNDQNFDETLTETVMVVVTSSNGDIEEVLLTETGPDTGVFTGYVQTSRDPVVPYNCVLNVSGDSTIQASYTDPDDGTDSASGNTLVDPFGIVFSSLDGQPVNGVTVRLINAATGLPAVPGVDIFGDDGVSAYPNTLVTGGTATDAGGTLYNFPNGGYRFPLLPPGNYRLEIISSPGYTAPSQVDIPTLQTLPGAPFALLSDASYGQTFVLNPGPPLHVDIPADPNVGQLVIEKTALRSDAGIGDFIPYRVMLENTDPDAASPGIIITDTLPRGFRYRTGSTRLNNTGIADPQIDTTGRELRFAVGNLAAGATLSLTYVTEVSAGTPMGTAINRANASDILGAVSNVAQAAVEVRDEFMRETNTVVGRVIVGNCPLISPENGESTLRMRSARRGDAIEYTLSFGVNDVRVSEYRLEVDLPPELRYQPMSAQLDGYSLSDPTIEGKRHYFIFDARRFENKWNWKHTVRFRVKIDENAYGRFETIARAVISTETDPNQLTPDVRNELYRSATVHDEKEFVFMPQGNEEDLLEGETRQLDNIMQIIGDLNIVEIDITGAGNQDEIGQLTRADLAAFYLRSNLNLQADQVNVITDSAAENSDLRIRVLLKMADAIDDIVIADSGESASRVVAYSHAREAASVGNNLPGLANARIYLEDGTYALTDENGKYHFTGLRPGTRVVQLDLHSLPANVKVIDCERNTRVAGTPYSRFVDLAPGSLWRVDFHVEQDGPETAQANLQMRTRLEGDLLRYSIVNDGGAVPAANYRLTAILPTGVEYQAGSARLNGSPVADPQISDSILVFRLGDFARDWNATLEFDARIRNTPDGRLISKAAAMLDTDTTKGQRIPPVETVALVEGVKQESRQYVFQPRFQTLSAELTVADKRELDAILPQLRDTKIQHVHVVGHTDNMPISASGQKLFANNEALSLSRAQSVATYLQTMLELEPGKISSEGRGEREPVADNSTAEGRDKNRRVEIFIDAMRATSADVSAMLKPVSEKSAAILTGKPVSIEQKPLVQLPPTTERSISQFDEDWLEQASPGVEWLMPVEGFIPAIPSVNIAIKHAPYDEVEAKLNGQRLNPLYFFGVKSNSRGTVARSYWQGVHLKDGPNTLEFTVIGRNGARTVLERTVHFSGSPARAEIVQDYSYLVADGKNPPVLAVRFHDSWGRLVRPGIVGEFEVLPPYYGKERLDSMELDLLAAEDRHRPVYKVGENGIALIELEPTTQTGKAVLKFAFNEKQSATIEGWLKPAKRDWIVVGVADATVGNNTVSGNIEAAMDAGIKADNYDDSKLAFFAKGNLGEDWLLTTSVDTSREKPKADQSLFQTVDPDQFFTLYGDNSEQRHEAPTSEKVFVKLERDTLYAMFGDVETGLNETELSKYSRSVTGLKSEFQGELFSLNMFATETTQRFAKDEIQGDGTSGLYRLSRGNLVINSEKLRIETRDRFRSQDILEVRTLRRHLDYNIDYQTGAIFFRQSVPSRDLNFNPVFIVVEYESETDIEGEITAGARGAVHLNDGRFELGLTGISDGTFGAEGSLGGADITMQLGEGARLRLEYAGSTVDEAGVERTGEAYLAELNVNDERLAGRVYLREQAAGFGLGQQAGSETGTRKYGADGSYRLTENVSLNSELFREDNLNTEASRDVASANLAWVINRHSITGGLRNARDTMADGTENNSNLLLLGGSTRFFDDRMALRLNSEYALDSENNANPAYPTRHILGMDYKLTENIQAYIEQEFTEGLRQDSTSTRMGMRATPWALTNIDTAVEERTGEYGPRTFAVMGLTQGFRISERWSGDVSYDRSKTIRDGEGDEPFNENVPPASGTLNDDFTAISLGATWRGDMSTWVGRIEDRQGEREDKQGLLFGWHRDLKEGIAYGVDAQMFNSSFSDNSLNDTAHLRFSLAWRPVESKWIHLNRFDVKDENTRDSIGNETQTLKLINNWRGNWMPTRSNQLSFSYGIKYVLDTFEGFDYDSVTHYAGSEYRYDFNSRWDLGIHVDMLYSEKSSNREYSYGISTGVGLGRNLWLSGGYNIEGFKDDDFTLAGYTAKGPYIKLRFKFDQDTFGLNR